MAIGYLTLRLRRTQWFSGRGRFIVVLVLVLATACGVRSPTAPDPPSTVTPAAHVVIDGSGSVGAGYTVFVNSDQGKTDGLSVVPDGLRVSYEANQSWGFVAAALAGFTAIGARPSKDLSAFKTLRVQLRGASGGESVELGIKDADDADDGSETRHLIVLSSSWQTVQVPLSEFRTADLTRLYVMFEIVFNGRSPRTIFFRDVQFLQ